MMGHKILIAISEINGRNVLRFLRHFFILTLTSTNKFFKSIIFLIYILFDFLD